MDAKERILNGLRASNERGCADIVDAVVTTVVEAKDDTDAETESFVVHWIPGAVGSQQHGGPPPGRDDAPSIAVLPTTKPFVVVGVLAILRYRPHCALEALRLSRLIRLAQDERTAQSALAWIISKPRAWSVRLFRACRQDACCCEGFLSPLSLPARIVPALDGDFCKPVRLNVAPSSPTVVSRPTKPFLLVEDEPIQPSAPVVLTLPSSSALRPFPIV